MKRWISVLAAVLLSGAALCGQTENAPPPTLGPPPGETRPTLGMPAPSLNGPLSATIMNAGKLKRIKTVFIGRMDNQLNLKLRDDFGKTGPFRVVTDRRRADAILQGTCFDSLHLKEVHSEVFLTGQDGKAIWQDVIHQPYHPPSLPQAVTATANQIVVQLKESIRAVERR